MRDSYEAAILTTNNNAQPDPNWLLQGRIIPASVTGTEPVLYMQTRHQTWLESHYHTGHCAIPAGVAVEIAMTVCVPFASKLLTKSYDLAEFSRGLFYTQMVRMITPSQTVGFITVTGMTALIKLDGIDGLFRYDDSCGACSESETYAISTDVMDRMLEGIKDERTH